MYDLIYPWCGESCCVLLSAPRGFHEYGTALHVGLSLSISVHMRMVAILWCDVLNDEWWVVVIDELMRNSDLLYLISMRIPTYYCIIVMTHSLCVVCVWILWWSRTLCSWEQMVRWIVMEDLVREDLGKHALWYMWHRGLGHCIFLFIVFRLLISKTLIRICLGKFMHLTLRILSLNVNPLPFWEATFTFMSCFHN